MNKDNQFGNVLRIESDSYKHRSIVKNDHPNLKYRFFQLTDMKNIDISTESGLKKFRDIFPRMSKFSVDSIVNAVQKGPIHFWPTGGTTEGTDSSKVEPTFDGLCNTEEDKLYNIWAVYMMTVPLHRQKEIAGYYHEYDKIIKETSDIIFKLFIYENPKHLPFSFDINPRISELAERSVNRELQRINKGTIFLSNSSGGINYSNVKKNLLFLLKYENGGSLYRIHRNCQMYLDILETRKRENL
jgi:hypothetical protein